jgi:thiosulfate/3-mercaptopyruvate sulfurtransferase
VVDARATDRYRGDAEPVDPRAGHIPGAVSVPCMLHVQGGRLIAPDELRAQFAAAGITSAQGVVAYCGSGVNACHTLLVMEHAGLGRGRLFPGSWSAWSNRDDRPVATGD